MPAFHFTIPFDPIPLTSAKILMLAGKRFGRLLVVSFYCRDAKGRLMWLCLCDCKHWALCQTNNLRTGTTRSCGCRSRELSQARFVTHGEASTTTKTPEYRAYQNAKSRCTNPRLREYANYAGRGIEFRFDTFADFLTEIGRRPSPQHTLERKDVNGHYEKGNVCWATQTEQQNNRRDNRHLVIDGVSRTMAEWSKESGIGYHMIRDRLSRRWCNKCSVTLLRQSTCPHKSSLVLGEKEKTYVFEDA